MTETESPPARAAAATRQRRDIRDRMQTAVITSWETVNHDDLAVFHIKRPDGQPFFDFKPGQYVQLAFRDQPVDDRRPRAYSIASTPFERDQLEIHIVLVRDELPDGGERLGTFTGTLWRHGVGDSMLYMGPVGRFTLDRTAQPEIVCVATGTGLAPFVSFARTLWREYHETGRVRRRLTIVHGVSYARDLGYRELLENMAADGDFGLQYLPVISRPDRDPDYTPDLGRGRANDVIRLNFGAPKSGRVEPWLPEPLAAALRRRLTSETAAMYLCGNPGLISDCRGVLADRGFTTEGRDAQVLTEDYW